MTDAMNTKSVDTHQQGAGDPSNDQPLISSVLPIDVLFEEYKNNSSYAAKVKWLKDKSGFVGMRKLRGDGNCFYRAFGFAYVQTILSMDDRPLHHFTTQHLESTIEMLKHAGTEEEIAREFFEPLRLLMNMIQSTDPTVPSLTEAKLVEVFNDPEQSNSIVVYLRLVTSAFLKLNANDYTPFLVMDEGRDPPTMQDFCTGEVEAFGKDADHLQITALCTALKVSLDVVYLSRSDAPPEEDPAKDPGNAQLSESTAQDANACDVVRFDIDQGQMFGLGPLLYRPGHFDLLVGKGPAESPDIDISTRS
ncbi:ubiquitinyl hydrolase 1 [Malassezia sp. CBS 17886]|nr:ubiquitinyl hydrolase 1 [Malassezia sp. CBS 17886]